jgi:hypothetical protein
VTSVQRARSPDSPAESATPGSVFSHEMLQLAHGSPIAAVGACHARLGGKLRAMLRADGAERLGELNPTELGHLAYERDLFSEDSRSGVEGLGVMHMLALLDDGGRQLDLAKAREYIGLTEALLFALKLRAGK